MNIAKKEMCRSRLLDLLVGLTDIFDSSLSALQLEVTGMQIDNRFLQPGDLFIACFGKNHDARNYIDRAILDGSSAVLVESDCNSVISVSPSKNRNGEGVSKNKVVSDNGP